jgi:hypothetical protein
MASVTTIYKTLSSPSLYVLAINWFNGNEIDYQAAGWEWELELVFKLVVQLPA